MPSLVNGGRKPAWRNWLRPLRTTMTWRGVDSGRPSGRSVGTDAGRPRPQTLPRRRPRGFIQQADHHLGVCPARVSPLMAIPVETITSAGTGWVITFLGWLSLVLYHCWLDPFGSPTPATEFHGDKKPAPLRTSWVHEVMRSRSIWAAAIMDDGSCAKITLGVQTLRNGLMTSTFFCSTAFGLLTLAVGVFLESFKGGSILPSGPEVFKFPAGQIQTLAGIKFATVVILLTVSACSFSLCARHMMHCSFALTIANDEPGSPVTKASVQLMMCKAERTWWLGLRFLYFLLPAIAWVTCGALGLLIGAAGLLFWLREVDQPPGAQLSKGLGKYFLS